MGTLDLLVRQGKALYVGLSNYHPAEAAKALAILKDLGTPCLIHQPKYSMFERWVEEEGLLDLLEQEGVGCIPFSPLAQGMLTNKYLKGIPQDSRAAKGHGALQETELTQERLDKIKRLHKLAQEREQSLAQMALAWLLKDKRVTSVLIGVSKPEQLIDSLRCLNNTSFSETELNSIEEILKS